MFEKAKLKKQIKKCRDEIDAIEKKRYRSQAALVAAILSSEEPNDDDVEYFNQYSAVINSVRDKMHEYQKELDELNK